MTTIPARPSDLIDLHNLVMGYFEKPAPPPKLTPRELLLKELLDSDLPVPIPCNYADFMVFADCNMDAFCEEYGLTYEVVRQYFIHDGKRHYLPRLFYEFSWKNDNTL